MKACEVVFEAFNVAIILCCGKKEDVANFLDEKNYNFFISDWKDNRDGLCCSFDNNEVLVWLKRVPRSTLDKSILVHELSHAVTEVFGYLNMKYDENTEELYAYLLGYLYKEFNDALRTSGSVCQNSATSEQRVKKGE